jgi:indolepyruvate decarboxylase
LDADAARFDFIEPITALAEGNDIPLAHLIPGKGVISDAHPLSIGIYRGGASWPTVRAAVENSDRAAALSGPTATKKEPDY